MASHPHQQSRRAFCARVHRYAAAASFVAAVAVPSIRAAAADPSITFPTAPPAPLDFLLGIDFIPGIRGPTGAPEPLGGGAPVFVMPPITVTANEDGNSIAIAAALAISKANPAGPGHFRVGVDGKMTFDFDRVNSLTFYSPEGGLPLGFKPQLSIDNGQKVGIQFGPDPFSGKNVLTSVGTYELTDGASLALTFSEAIGKSGDEIASDLASLINALSPSFAALAAGNIVTFSDVFAASSAEISFTPTGAGLDYGIFPAAASVPEPTTYILLGAGLSILVRLNWRRPRARPGVA